MNRCVSIVPTEEDTVIVWVSTIKVLVIVVVEVRVVSSQSVASRPKWMTDKLPSLSVIAGSTLTETRWSPGTAAPDASVNADATKSLKLRIVDGGVCLF